MGSPPVVRRSLIAVVLLACVLLYPLPTAAEGSPLFLARGDGPPLTLAYRPDADVTLDAHFDEPAWSALEPITDFTAIEPDTLAKGSLPTRMWLFYTDQGLYLGAELEQPTDSLLERLSGRDQGFLNRDNVSITLDTSGEARYGFWFQVSLGDSIADGTILPERQYSVNWDGAWQRASRRTHNGWAAEVFIPWSLVSMPKRDGKRTIGVFLSRRIAHLNERWAWPALPSTQSRFFSRLQKFELANVAPRQQWSLFPYLSANHDRLAARSTLNTGVDLFWRPSSNLQATAALKPDFGAVEADDVIVNFSANEVFFPEKRLFFQEGQEIFQTTPRSNARNNFNPLTLVNTRRIGGRALLPELPADASLSGVERNRPVDLLGAAKVGGQIGRLRYGVLGAVEDDIALRATTADGSEVRVAQNGRDFGVARALYERNDGGAYLAAGWLGTSVRHPDRDARVNAVDLHYYSPDRVWSGDAQFVSSRIDTDSRERGYGGFADLAYAPRQGMRHNLQLEYFDADLEVNDLGFMRRVDTYGARYSFRRDRSGARRYRSLRTNGFLGAGWNGAGRLILAGSNLRQELQFNNRTRLSYGLGLSPARFDDRNSFGNGTYSINTRWDGRVAFSSDNSRRLAFNTRLDVHEEDLGGARVTVQSGVTWRVSNRTTTELSVRYRQRNGWLLHRDDDRFATFNATEWAPRLNVDFFPSARQQIRVALQWVGIRADERERFVLPDNSTRLVAAQRESGAAAEDFTVSRVNLQVRYRWELAPLSDLFLVYTRNTELPSTPGAGFGALFGDGFASPVDEQLVLKLRYRLGR